MWSIVLIFIVLLFPSVQSAIASFVTKKLNETYNVDIKIEKTSISITGIVTLRQVLIRDFKKDTLISAGKLRTSIANFNKLLNGDLYFGSVYGEDLRLDMKTYKGDTLSNLDVFVNSFDSGEPASDVPFVMKTKNIQLKNTRFRLFDYNSLQAQQVDIDSITAKITDFSIYNSDINLNVKSGSLLFDKSLRVNDLKTEFSYTDSLITLGNTQIKTPFSDISGRIEFWAKDNSFSNFLNNVTLDAQIEKSVVGTDDINIFYNGFSSGKTIDIQTHIRGVLNDFSAERTQAFHQNTTILGDFELENVFDDTKKIQVRGSVEKIASIYSDLTELMPKDLGENLPENLREFGFFEGSGTFGYITDAIELDMAFFSEIGSFDIEGMLSDFSDTKKSIYKGYVTTQQFDVGKFLSMKDLGIVSAEIQFVGNGLELNTLDKVSVNGRINQLFYNNYLYQEIKLRGDLRSKNFSGEISVNDPNLKINLSGLGNIGRAKEYNITADVDFANLKKLNFVKDSIANLQGIVSLEVQGSSIDDFTGKINFKKINYLKNNTQYKFQDFLIDASVNENNQRTIVINSPDIITGKLSGSFKISELGKIFQNSLGSVYTNYEPFKVTEGQHVDFDLKIYNKIVEIFFPNVSLGKDTSVKGNIVSDQNDFKLKFQSPSIDIGSVKLDKINLLVDNKNPLYNAYFEINQINTGFYKMNGFHLINTAIKDTLFFRTEFKGEKSDAYTLNFYHTMNKKRASVVGLKKSKLFFKGNEWVINKDNRENKIIFNRNLDSISIENFKMEHHNQSISLNGKLLKNTHKDIHLVFKNVELFDITPEIDGLLLTGAVNGRLSLIQQNDKYFPSSDLVVENFTLNKYAMGDLEIGIEGNENLTSFAVNTQFINEKNEGFRTIGNIFIRNDKTYLELDASLQKLNLSPFNPLTEGILSNLRGNMTGWAHISGFLTNPNVEGTIKLENAGMGIPYLNIDTSFDPNATITLKNNNFIFNDIGLTDVVYKTKAVLAGKIYHKNLLDWFLDLSIDTKNNRFLVLNTTSVDNDLFYGTGFIKGNATISGNVNNLILKVNAVTGEGTKFKIPLSDTQTVGDDSFINFVAKKKVIDDNELQETTFEGIEMYFDLNVLPTAEVEIIIDPKTNSNLLGRGAGTLLFEINTNGKFNMWGDFITTSGVYNFKYENIIDKKFKVLPGGSITWNGNPLSAELQNLKAVYSLYANPAVLLESSQYNRKINTQVQISLEGSLSHPQTVFDINFPDSNSGLISELEYHLKDTDKKQLQAFSLLLQGNFLSDTSAGEKVVAYNMLETATGIFNQLLAGNDDKLNLGISYESGVIDPNQSYNTNDRLGITFSSQITDRFLINGKLGIPIGGVTQTAIAGDIEAQYLLSKDGNLSIKAFNRENEVQQYLLDKIGYTQGVGIFYKIDFNSFKELLNQILARKKEENE